MPGTACTCSLQAQQFTQLLVSCIQGTETHTWEVFVQCQVMVPV